MKLPEKNKYQKFCPLEGVLRFFWWLAQGERVALQPPLGALCINGWWGESGNAPCIWEGAPGSPAPGSEMELPGTRLCLWPTENRVLVPPGSLSPDTGGWQLRGADRYSQGICPRDEALPWS